MRHLPETFANPTSFLFAGEEFRLIKVSKDDWNPNLTAPKDAVEQVDWSQFGAAEDEDEETNVVGGEIDFEIDEEAEEDEEDQGGKKKKSEGKAKQSKGKGKDASKGPDASKGTDTTVANLKSRLEQLEANYGARVVGNPEVEQLFEELLRYANAGDEEGFNMAESDLVDMLT